jgi:hypothetical protein
MVCNEGDVEGAKMWNLRETLEEVVLKKSAKIKSRNR